MIVPSEAEVQAMAEKENPELPQQKERYYEHDAELQCQCPRHEGHRGVC